MAFQSIATPSAELEYVSGRDGGFKQPLERCKLLTLCLLFIHPRAPNLINAR